MVIKIKYLRDIDKVNIIKNGDWIDLRCAEATYIRKNEYKAIPLGVAMEIPEGYTAIVAPRSSLFSKYGIICANSFGVIDNSYSGDSDEWHFLAYSTRYTYIEKGARICQFRLIKQHPEIEFLEVETLGNENRGGLGSTGDK